MGALNKLSEQNFEAIRERVASLVASGDVGSDQAAKAILEKSADDSCFAHVYARLLKAIVGGCAPDAACIIAEIQKFLDQLFGGEGTRGESLWKDLESVAETMDASGAAPAEGTPAYDVFCLAVKAKKRLLGRHRTALAVLSAMARDVGAGAPKPGQVVEVTLVVLGIAAARQEDPTVPVDLALDLAEQIAEALTSSDAPNSHATALVALRAGIASALTDDVLSAYGPRTRFKVKDLLAPQSQQGGRQQQKQQQQQQQHPVVNKQQQQQQQQQQKSQGRNGNGGAPRRETPTPTPTTRRAADSSGAWRKK
jgi:hypothetical protein